MDHEQERQEIRSKLTRYEALARSFSDGSTLDNLRKEIEQLQRRLRELEK